MFQASRDRLEDPGFCAMAEVFAKQKSLQTLEVFQNGAKKGFKNLYAALTQCKETLRSINVSDNYGMNGAIPEFCEMMASCQRLTKLDISDLNLKRDHFLTVAQAINQNESLADLRWNYDLQKSNTLAKQIITTFAQKVTNRSNKLQKITMNGIFTSRANREEMTALFPADSGMKLVLFEPNFTDEESDDITEEDSEGAENAD